ncbi:MAG: orotate phosphoribosyltransferase [Eubacteriales bacterium]|nr:orotate phosphoribosyltransferase [Eubacteriales bacterium]
MKKLESRVIELNSKKYGNIVPIRAIPGHFVTSHSHINYFIDVTLLKSNQIDAANCAHALAHQYTSMDPIDTIICLDGTGIIGAFLSQELQAQYSNAEKKKIYVICPECANNGQMFFRHNVEPMVHGKNVILLLATVTTGISIRRGMECMDYYGGNLKGVFTIFSAIDEIGSTAINTIFTKEDIPGYASYLRRDCPFCKNKAPIEALVNSYGYSQL